MQFKSTYLALALMAGFGLALGACSSSSDDPPPEMEVVEPDPEPTPAETQQAAIDSAIAAAMAAVGAVNDDSSDAMVTAADDAIAAASAAIAAAADISNAAAATARGQVAGIQATLDAATESRQMAMDAAAEKERMEMEAAQRLADQRQAIMDTVAAARMAVNAVNDDSDDATVMAADDAVAAARQAIADASDVPADETAAASTTVGDLAGQLASAKSSRMAAMNLGSQLEMAQTAASDAADAAMTAAGNAKTSADDADMARMNAATIQTGQMSGDLAMKARAQADAAHDAYMAAKMASEAAAAATEVADAVRAQADAEDAQGMAEEAETMAADYGQQSMEAAGMELMIDGTMKSVGDTMIDATADNQMITTIVDGDETTSNTGFQADLEEEMTEAVTGVAFRANTDPTDDVAYVQAVAARDITIGKTVDSADDDARLAIVTAYADTKTVKVFTYLEAAPEITSTAPGRTGTKLGYVSRDDGDATTGVALDPNAPTTLTDVNNVRLRSVGTYYLAGVAADTDGLAATDLVGAEAKPSAVYSFVDSGGTPTTDDDATVYLVANSQRTAGGTTTYIYRSVDITAPAADADETDGTAEEVQVTAEIPVAEDYDHIHFGVWANLKGPGNAQSIDGLGIGFVQSIGDGMTAADDMPNHGDAIYNGNWVATIQAADLDGDGVVTLKDGEASMEAKFAKDTVEATLTGLATLEGTITGATFSGTKATVAADNTSDLTASSDDVAFTGSFNGAFFGERAAEAGGVFDFESEDNEAGAFRGSFGGAR